MHSNHSPVFLFSFCFTALGFPIGRDWACEVLKQSLPHWCTKNSDKLPATGVVGLMFYLDRQMFLFNAFPGCFPRIVGLSLPHSLCRVRVESHTFGETVGLSADHSLHRVRVGVQAMVKLWVCLQTTPYTGWGWESKPWWNCGSVCGPLPTQGEGGSLSHGETVGLSADPSLHRVRVGVQAMVKLGLSVDHSLHRVIVEVWAMVKLWVCLQTTPYTGWWWESKPWWNSGSVCGPLPTQGEDGSPSHGETVGLSADCCLHRVEVESHTLGETVGWSVDNSLHRARVKSHTLAETVGRSVDHSLHYIVQWNFKTTLKVESGWSVHANLKGTVSEKVVFTKVWLLVMGMFKWKYEGNSFRKSGLSKGVVVGRGNMMGKGCRKNGLNRGVHVGHGHVYMEIWRERFQEKQS